MQIGTINNMVADDPSGIICSKSDICLYDATITLHKVVVSTAAPCA